MLLLLLPPPPIGLGSWTYAVRMEFWNQSCKTVPRIALFRVSYIYTCIIRVHYACACSMVYGWRWWWQKVTKKKRSVLIREGTRSQTFSCVSTYRMICCIIWQGKISRCSFLLDFILFWSFHSPKYCPPVLYLLDYYHFYCGGGCCFACIAAVCVVE